MSRDQTAHEVGVSRRCVTNFFQTFRSACVDWLSENQKPIGGDNCTVEIDESLMSKRKNHAGRALQQHWIFGGICRETKEKFILSVPARSAETLIPLIKENISQNTHIISNLWKSYDTIQTLEQNYSHTTVNHSTNFVDPITKSHTQNIERVWREVKRVKRHYEGIPHDEVDQHMAEYLWLNTFISIVFPGIYNKYLSCIVESLKSYNYGSDCA